MKRERQDKVEQLIIAVIVIASIGAILHGAWALNQIRHEQGKSSIRLGIR